MQEKESYRMVKDEGGDKYYCPLGAIDNNERMKRDRWDECVETDVVQRYSGNIHVLRS